MVGPSSLKGRYITEDVPYGLVPLAQLARGFGVDIPIIDATIRMASLINEADYYKQGMSLEELGIAGLGKQELADTLREGFREGLKDIFTRGVIGIGKLHAISAGRNFREVY